MGQAARLKRERAAPRTHARKPEPAPDGVATRFMETARQAVAAIERGEDAEWPALAFYDRDDRLEYYLTLDPVTHEQVKVRSERELRVLIGGD